MPVLAPLAWLVIGLTVPLSGTVRDASGRPVAGATVWLGDTFSKREGPEVLATGKTDHQGRFRLERTDDLAGRGSFWSPTLWAYAPGHRIAFKEFKTNLPKANEPVHLVLGAEGTIPLRVLQPDGKPAAGGAVRVVMLTLKAPLPPDGMLDQLAAVTGADGKAALDGFTPKDIFAVDVTAKDQLVQCLPIDDDNTIKLRPLGRLEVRIVADDPKAVRGWTITASSRPTEPGYRGPYTTHWYRETTGQDGRITFPPIAVGQVIWQIKPPEDSNDLVPKQPAATIRVGETEKVELKLVRGVRVEGTVLEEPGGAPIPGVTVDINSLTHFSGGVNRMVTDAKGHFSTLVLPGQIRFSFGLHELPKTHFLPLSTPHWADFQVKEGIDRMTFTPPPLHRAVQVRGRVVDQVGKPVSMVNVSGTWSTAEDRSRVGSVYAETDTNGEFVLGSIAPDATLKLSAAQGRVAESETVTVPSAGDGGPITLVLVKRLTLSLAGRVLDSDGQPLAGATVHVKIAQLDQPFDMGAECPFEGLDELRTGRDGRYRTPDQIPIGYRVSRHGGGARVRAGGNRVDGQAGRQRG